MDAGHHNCRDYYLKPEDTVAKSNVPVSTASVLATRAARTSQKSPLNGPARRPDAFPFLKLPLELRRHVYAYLLPCTIDQSEPRQFFQSITSKRVPPTHTNLPPDVLRRLLLQPAASSVTTGKDNPIWRRGQISLLAVSRQLHDECADLLYGESTFVIFVTYDSITFRFRWSLPNGLCPNRTYEFLDLVSAKYLRLVKRLVVTVDHVDSYTGEIKYNVGGKGLTYGLRNQVSTLIRALKEAYRQRGRESKKDTRFDGGQALKWLTIKLQNGNDHLDAEKRNMVKAKENSVRGIEEVQTVLEPLMELKDLVKLEVSGSVTEKFVMRLKEATGSAEREGLH